MEWYLKVVRDNYGNFNGRARRKEYWMFVLVNFLIEATLYILLGVFFVTMPTLGVVMFVIIPLYYLAVTIPSLAVTVRRLHDNNQSGWILFVALIPLFGLIYIIYLLATEGEQGSNQYGDDPKGAVDQDLFEDQNSTRNPFSENNNTFRNNS